MSVKLVNSGEIFVLESDQPLGQIFELDPDYAVVAYQHRGSWHLLHFSEIVQLRQEWSSGADPESLLGSRGEVVTVSLGARPTRPAVVLDALGEVSGAWLAESARERRQKQAAPPLRGRPSARRSVLGRAADKLGDLGLVFGGGASRAEDAPEAAAPEAEDGSSEGSSETVRRTPHVDAPDELVKAPGTEFPVFVYLDEKELRAGESGEGIELDLPPDIDAVDVGALLQLTGHFELAEGSEFGTITVARDEKESAKLEFKLRVTAEQPPGPAAISVLFTLRGRSCGNVARVWDWATEAAKAPRLEVGAKAPVSMPLHVEAEQASLSIFITAPLNDGIHYQCAVQAPALEGYEEPTESQEFAVPAQGYAFMKTLLSALTDPKRTSAARFRALREVGHSAWSAAPPIVQEVLWKMIENGVPPKTINVASVEPVLPWELMIPWRTVAGKRESLGPLGVEFAIGRWTRGDGQGPPPSLKVGRAFVIAPAYGKNRELDYKAELELVEDKLCGQRVQPATIEDLNQRFGEDHAALLHFVCHGASGVENDDAIELDAKELLRAGEMETLDGFERLCQATHPLVFLNSCSTGQMVPSLAGGAGFPRSFGNLGANAIIAPLWPVDDTLAREVALELYREALAPGAESIAEILRGIRQRGYEAEDADTFAAYCFFGDPQARLELLDCADPS